MLTRLYDTTDEKLAGIIDQFLRIHQFQIERRDQVRAALEQYKRRPAGFPDCLPGPLNQNAGCEKTVTFD